MCGRTTFSPKSLRSLTFMVSVSLRCGAPSAPPFTTNIIINVPRISLIVRSGSRLHKATGDANSKINSYSAYLEALFFPRNQHQNFKIKNIPRVSWGGAGRERLFDGGFAMRR